MSNFNTNNNNNDKVKSVRLYKIGGYQAPASSETNHDSKNAFHTRKNHFKDPRNFYFNPYMPNPAVPPRFHQSYRRTNMPPQPKFHSQYYQGNNYYSWNDPRMVLHGNHDDDNDSDDEYEEDESEEADTDIDDDEEDIEDDEEDEDDEDDSDDTENETLIEKKDKINNQPGQQKLIENEKRLTSKSNQVSDSLKLNTENFVKEKVIENEKKSTSKPNQLSNHFNSNNENYLKEKIIENDKSYIRVLDEKVPTSNNKDADPTAVSKVEQSRPRSSRVFPIKGTTKKVVKITSAEVIESPYIQSQPILKNKTTSFESSKNNEANPDQTLLSQPSKENISKDSETLIHNKNENDNNLIKTPILDKPPIEIKSNEQKIEIEKDKSNSEPESIAQVNLAQEPIITHHNDENDYQVTEEQINEKNLNKKTDHSLIDNNFNDIKPTSSSIRIPQADYEDENDMLSPSNNEVENNLEVDHEIEIEKNEFESNKSIDIDYLHTNQEFKENETEPTDNIKENVKEKNKKINEMEMVDLLKVDEDKINRTERTESKLSVVKELHEEDPDDKLEGELVDTNFNEKSFKKSDKEIEVLPTIVEMSQVSKKELEKKIAKDLKDKTKKKESKPKKDHFKAKVSKAVVKPKETSPIETHKKLTDTDRSNIELKNMHVARNLELEENSEEKPDQLERENSIFFGKIGKIEMPTPLSSSISPAPTDFEQISEHDQRINEIIEENKSHLFEIKDYKDNNTISLNELKECTCFMNAEEEAISENDQQELNIQTNSKIAHSLTKRSKLKNKFIKKTQKIDPSQITKQVNSLSLLERAYSDLSLKKSKTNLPSLANLDEKTKEKPKAEDDSREPNNYIKFPSLFTSEKSEDFKSVSNCANTYIRKYFDPKFKRCPCLMHNRLYYEEGRDWEPDIEPYEMRPFSIKDSKVSFVTPNYLNSAADYQLIYGERFVGFFPSRLKSVNEIFTDVEEDFLNTRDSEACYSKLTNTQKLHRRDPWNNKF